jgi:hypothetical protein
MNIPVSHDVVRASTRLQVMCDAGYDTDAIPAPYDAEDTIRAVEKLGLLIELCDSIQSFGAMDGGMPEAISLMAEEVTSSFDAFKSIGAGPTYDWLSPVDYLQRAIRPLRCLYEYSPQTKNIDAVSEILISYVHPDNRASALLRHATLSHAIDLLKD